MDAYFHGIVFQLLSDMRVLFTYLFVCNFFLIRSNNEIRFLNIRDGFLFYFESQNYLMNSVQVIPKKYKFECLSLQISGKK